MANYVLGKDSFDWLKHETDPCLNRRAATILSGQGKLKTGTVVGKIATASASSAAKSGGNTGDGTLTLDVTTPVIAGAMAGVYKVRFVAAATNGGQFEVEDPTGVVIGTASVGDTWSEGVKFVIADGATDFVVGDGFDITVAAGSGKWTQIGFANIDGTQKASGIVIEAQDASSADAEAAVLVKDAQIVANQLTWPDGATTQQKNDALAELEQLGIVDLQRY